MKQQLEELSVTDALAAKAITDLTTSLSAFHASVSMMMHRLQTHLAMVDEDPLFAVDAVPDMFRVLLFNDAISSNIGAADLLKQLDGETCARLATIAAAAKPTNATLLAMHDKKLHEVMKSLERFGNDGDRCNVHWSVYDADSPVMKLRNARVRVDALKFLMKVRLPFIQVRENGKAAHGLPKFLVTIPSPAGFNSKTFFSIINALKLQEIELEFVEVSTPPRMLSFSSSVLTVEDFTKDPKIKDFYEGYVAGSKVPCVAVILATGAPATSCASVVNRQGRWLPVFYYAAAPPPTTATVVTNPGGQYFQAVKKERFFENHSRLLGIQLGAGVLRFIVAAKHVIPVGEEELPKALAALPGFRVEVSASWSCESWTGPGQLFTWYRPTLHAEPSVAPQPQLPSQPPTRTISEIRSYLKRYCLDWYVSYLHGTEQVVLTVVCSDSAETYREWCCLAQIDEDLALPAIFVNRYHQHGNDSAMEADEKAVTSTEPPPTPVKIDALSHKHHKVVSAMRHNNVIHIAVPVKGFIPLTEQPLPKRWQDCAVKIVLGWRSFASAGYGTPLHKHTIGPGYAVGTRENADYLYGTLGCFLTFRGRVYGLTCAHVVAEYMCEGGCLLPPRYDTDILHSTGYALVDLPLQERIFEDQHLLPIDDEALMDVEHAIDLTGTEEEMLSLRCRIIGKMKAYRYNADMGDVALFEIDPRQCAFLVRRQRAGVSSITPPEMLIAIQNDFTYDVTTVASQGEVMGVAPHVVGGHGVGASTPGEISLVFNVYEDATHPCLGTTYTTGPGLRVGDSGSVAWTGNFAPTFPKQYRSEITNPHRCFVGMGFAISCMENASALSYYNPMEKVLHAAVDMLQELAIIENIV